MNPFLSNNRVIGKLTVIHVVKKTGERRVICKDKTNLLTNAGRDAIIDAMYVDTSATQVGFNFIAVSANATPPADGDTSLTGEIATSGLSRASATTNHVGGSLSVSVTKTFTLTSAVNQIQKAGLFDAVSVGTLGHENSFDPIDLSTDDDLIITWVITVND